jgi:hypothetical protein
VLCRYQQFTLRLLPAGAAVAGWAIFLPLDERVPFHGALGIRVKRKCHSVYSFGQSCHEIIWRGPILYIHLLQRVVASQIDQTLLDDIAATHRQVRRLFILMTSAVQNNGWLNR